MITLSVGLGSCGISSGALEIYDALKKDASVSLKKAGCIGACFLEPVVEMKVDDFETLIFANVRKEDAKQIIEIGRALEKKKEKGARKVYAKRKDGNLIFKNAKYINDTDFFSGQQKNVSLMCGIVDPESISDYAAHSGFSALKKAFSMKPEEIVREVSESGLRGRGGAGFPTGKKWEIMLNYPEKEHYLICNFDEGDPGAFMNRVLVESDPCLIIEGIAIAAYALKVSEAFIYTRSEYPLAVERLKNAISECEKSNFLGENMLGTGFSLKISLRLGAGAFVCGEETALISSIEGKSGRPFPKPPYPAEKGLFGMPTIINNVETLANIPSIILNGASWFRGAGTETSPGTKMFSLSGDVKRSGYIEVPFGTTLSAVAGIAGLKQNEFKAIQLGGPSGGLVGKAHASMPLDYESLRGADAIVGSGGIVFIGKDKNVVDVIHHGLRFIVSESCGRCTPCREGSMRMYEIMERISAGKGTAEDLLNLHVLSNTIKSTSLCGLGETAPNLVLSSIRNFFSEYEERIPLWKGKAPNRLSFRIDSVKCNGCHLCAAVCPKMAISGKISETHEINQGMCIKCGLCKKECPFSAISENLAENDRRLEIEKAGKK
jgi:NADH-quinone oxidoreductase subunit F